MMADYYNLLGVPRDASPTEIRQAFRARAKAVHPDTHPHLQGEAREAQHRAFIQLAEAYNTLANPTRRATHDRQTQAANGPTATGKRRTRHQRTNTAGTDQGAGTARGARTARAARSARARQTRSAPHGDQAQSAPRGTAPHPDLNKLLKDVDDLLGRFGLDRRLPVERLLDELLDWAREIYRQVGEVLNSTTAPGESATNSHGSSTYYQAHREGQAQRNRAAYNRPSPSGGATGTSKSTGTTKAKDDVEAELQRIKCKLGKT